MTSKNSIVKKITLDAWENLGTARRVLFAEEYARILMDSDEYSSKFKPTLFAAISSIGWALNELSKEGYGYNSSSEAWYDRDSAGKLSKNNKNSVWVWDE